MSFPFTPRANRKSGSDLHFHPINKENWTYGRLLASSESVRVGDVFNSDDGTWKACPSYWNNLAAGDFSPAMIVRPDPDG